AGDAAFGLVAEDLAARGDRGPQEREQGLAAFARIGAPEFAPQLLLLLPAAAVFLVQQQGVGAGEYFLPAKTIADDEHDVARPGRARCLSARGGLERGECQKQSAAEGGGRNSGQHQLSSVTPAQLRSRQLAARSYDTDVQQGRRRPHLRTPRRQAPRCPRDG